jgi:dTDP-glucose 4,6-dehydratase
VTRTLVAGGAGFVGSHLVDALIARGDDVVVVDDLCTGTRANLDHLGDQVEFVQADIADAAALETGLRGEFDRVFNLASPASPIDYYERPIETMMTGALGGKNLLDLSRRWGARYLLASTSEVYGDPLVHPQTEAYLGNVNPIGPRAVYDEAKRFGEAMAASYRREWDVDVAIIRIFNTYGPRMRANDGRAIPNFVAQALAGDPITVAGDGSQTRSICFVTDLVRGIIAMMDSGEFGPVNLGNPIEISMLDLATWIRDLIGSASQITFIDRPVDDPELRRPDISLAAQALGWAPEVSAEEGLRETIESFRARLS